MEAIALRLEAVALRLTSIGFLLLNDRVADRRCGPPASCPEEVRGVWTSGIHRFQKADAKQRTGFHGCISIWDAIGVVSSAERLSWPPHLPPFQSDHVVRHAAGTPPHGAKAPELTKRGASGSSCEWLCVRSSEKAGVHWRLQRIG